jgi:hypothetical protein
MMQLRLRNMQWTPVIGPYLPKEMGMLATNTKELVNIAAAAVTVRETGTIRLTESTGTSAAVMMADIAAINTDLLMTGIGRTDTKDAGMTDLANRKVDVAIIWILPRLRIQNLIGLETQ